MFILHSQWNRKKMKLNKIKCSSNSSLKNKKGSIIKPRTALPYLIRNGYTGDDYISLKSQISRYGKTTNVCIQELQLNNSKWLVFNEENSLWEDKNNTFTLGNKRGGQLQNRNKIGNFTVKENLRLITDFQEKSMHGEKSQSPIAKNQQSCLKSAIRSDKLKISRKVTLPQKEESLSREKSPCASSNRLPHSKSNKSSKSIKSVGSNRTLSRSKKLVNEEISKNACLLKQAIEQTKPQEKNSNVLVGQMDKHIKCEDWLDNRHVLLAKLYNQIELLNPNLLTNHLKTNVYDDFPQWRIMQPLEIPIPQKNQQVSSMPLPLLSPDIQACFQSAESKSIEPQPQRISNTQEIPLITLPLQQPPLICLENNQCLTTKQTESHQKTQSSNIEIEAIGEPPKADIFLQIEEEQRQSFKDRSFDQLDEFHQFKQIRMIQIDSNEQTALLPSKFSNQYLTAIPSTSRLHNQYKNDQLLQFLNHLIFVQPFIIQNVFLMPTIQGFCCVLYIEGEKKKVIVDGLFPFDVNYYPLYGFFDQFIWFSVFIKSIAKIKGSYAAISKLLFREIYSMLTGCNLLQFDMVINQYRALKQLRILLKYSKQISSSILLVKNRGNFYKINKIQTVQPTQKIKQIYKNQYSNKTSHSSEDHFKSLNNFLQKQTKVYEKNQLHQNTEIYLGGYQRKRKMTFKEFIDEGSEVYLSQDIRTAILKANLRMDCLNQK